MNFAFCHEHVKPARGGCETYIADLARRLLADRHEVHLYACRWDVAALPAGIRYHRLPRVPGPRFLRPWRFSRRCHEALANARHDLTIGFDKTWGLDVLFPQGGLHAATVEHNRDKHRGRLGRVLARLGKTFDLGHWSFSRLERRQYLEAQRPLIVVNSRMVQRHFQRYYGIAEDSVHVVHSAIHPERFQQPDRPRHRVDWRHRHGLAPTETVALFVARNYRLKGLEPLLLAVQRLTRRAEFRRSSGFRLVVAGSSRTREFRRMALSLGIDKHVRFLGNCDDITGGFFAADFLVHPTFYDPCSLVVLEGLACGLPVITTRQNGATELLRPLQEGYVIDTPHDTNHLAWCMAQLLDPSRRLVCSQAARQTAARWTFEQHYQRLMHILQPAATRRLAA
ncbi:MAG: glycosyltransferase family 4 protein [Planctomycetes bacterium]|nr:glycosyltransferase family 4 protein [Planctomycetota bacterium]